MSVEYGKEFWAEDEYGERARVCLTRETTKRTNENGTYGTATCIVGTWGSSFKVHVCTQSPCPLSKQPWEYRRTDRPPKHVRVVVDAVVAARPPPPTLPPAPIAVGRADAAEPRSGGARSSTTPLHPPRTDPPDMGSPHTMALPPPEHAAEPPTPPRPPPLPPPADPPPPAPPPPAPAANSPVVAGAQSSGTEGIGNEADPRPNGTNTGPAPAPLLRQATGVRANADDVIAVAENCFRKPYSFVGLTAPIVLGRV